MGGHSGVQSDLFNNSGTANNLEGLYGANAQQVNSTLTPALTQEAINPTGYTPAQMAAQTTAAEQTAGGASSGATGGALLRAARSRNSGAVGTSADQSNREGSQDLSNINAGIQTRNADLQQKQKQQGISGLEGLYGENVNAANQDIGLSTTALGDAGNLKNFWQQYLLQAQGNSNQAAAAAAGG